MTKAKMMNREDAVDVDGVVGAVGLRKPKTSARVTSGHHSPTILTKTILRAMILNSQLTLTGTPTNGILMAMKLLEGDDVDGADVAEDDPNRSHATTVILAISMTTNPVAKSHPHSTMITKMTKKLSKFAGDAVVDEDEVVATKVIVMCAAETMKMAAGRDVRVSEMAAIETATHRIEKLVRLGKTSPLGRKRSIYSLTRISKTTKNPPAAMGVADAVDDATRTNPKRIKSTNSD